MKLLSLAVGCTIAFTAWPAFGQTAMPIENPETSKVIADLEAGRSANAVAHISTIETLTGRPRLVTTGAEFVARMKGCKLNLHKGDSHPGKYIFERTEWRCPDGLTKVVFAAEPGSPYLIVAEYDDAARAAKLAASVPTIRAPAPLPPRPVNPAVQAANSERDAKTRDAFGQAILAGDLSSVSSFVTPTTHFTYGFHPPQATVTLTELDGYGMGKGKEIADMVRKKLGKPETVTCHHEVSVNVCVWGYASLDRTLLAFPVFSPDGSLAQVQFMYATRQKIIEAQRAAQLAGK